MSTPFGSTGPAIRQIEMARRARIDNDPTIQKWIKAGFCSPVSVVSAGVETYLGHAALRAELGGHCFYPYRPPAASSELDGPSVGLGFDWVSGEPIFRGANEFTKHMLAAGITGSGKSTFLALIMLQLAGLGYRVVMIDRDKTEGRSLAHLMNATVINIARDWPCSITEVPDCLTPGEYIRVLGDCLADAMGFQVASYNVFVSAVYELFKQHGVMDGSPNFPTMRQVLARVLSLRLHPSSRYGGVKQTVTDRIETMLREIPENYDFVLGIPVERLIGQNLVIETGDISDYHARLRILLLLSTLNLLSQKRGGTGGKLNLAVVIDETSSWFAPPVKNGEQRDSMKVPVLNKLVQQCRSAGIGLMFASQSVADLDRVILQNSSTKIVQRLGDGLCFDRIARSISLEPVQRGMLPRMGIGEAVCSIPLHYPIHLRIPNPFGGPSQ